MKIEFAPPIDPDDYRPGLVREFCSRVLDVHFDEAFISTESAVTDFDFTMSRDEWLAKIKEEFGADLSDMKGLLLIKDVLRRLERQ